MTMIVAQRVNTVALSLIPCLLPLMIGGTISSKPSTVCKKNYQNMNVYRYCKSFSIFSLQMMTSLIFSRF